MTYLLFFGAMKLLSFNPGTVLMVITHRRVGLQIVNPLRLCVWAAIMVFYGRLCHSDWMFGYTALFCAAGLWQYTHRRREMQQHDFTHTLSGGHCVLAYAEFLPAWLRCGALVDIWIEPVAWMVVGVLLLHFDRAFGFWLFYTGGAMRFETAQQYKEEKRIELIRQDKLVMATRIAKDVQERG